MTQEYRIESDSMGQMRVPADRYWGAQTQRSLENFRIGEEKMPRSIIHAFAVLKRAAAQANLELERLEPSWTDRLLELKETDLTGISLPDAMAWEPALEQLLVYFLYRQTPLALDDGEYEGRAAFAVLSFAMIRRLLLVHFVLHGSVVLADLIEIARQYSAEIEYSDENVEILLYRIQEAL